MQLFLSTLLALSSTNDAAASEVTAAELALHVPVATYDTVKHPADIGHCLVDRPNSVRRFSMLQHGERHTLTLDDGEAVRLLITIREGTASVRSIDPADEAERSSVEACL